MKIVRAAPPNFDEIASVFDVKGKPVLFAWGDTIYAPVSCNVPPQIEAHEAVHGARQIAYGAGIAGWWARYLRDAAFRLEEEKLGHMAEYRWLLQSASGRAERRFALSNVSARLSAALYRYSFTKDEARRYLENGHAGN